MLVAVPLFFATMGCNGLSASWLLLLVAAGNRPPPTQTRVQQILGFKIPSMPRYEPTEEAESRQSLIETEETKEEALLKQLERSIKDAIDKEVNGYSNITFAALESKLERNLKNANFYLKSRVTSTNMFTKKENESPVNTASRLILESSNYDETISPAFVLSHVKARMETAEEDSGVFFRFIDKIFNQGTTHQTKQEDAKRLVELCGYTAILNYFLENPVPATNK